MFNHHHNYHRKTHLLSMNREKGVAANGFNYWYYNNMLGPSNV